MNSLQVVQTNQSQHLVPQPQNFSLVNVMNFFADNASDFDDRGDWHGEQTAASSEQKCLNTGKSQRHAKLNGRAFAGLGEDLHGTLEAVQHGANHIHSDAAAGNFSHFGSSAETGLKNQIGHFRIEQAIDFISFQQAFLHGLFADAVEVQAATVIANFNHHLSSLVKSVQKNSAASS